MTAEPSRPVTSRVGAFDNLDAAGQARDELAARILGIGPRMTVAQVAEAGVSVVLVLVPTFRALVWAVLDVADAVREAAAPPPPDVRPDYVRTPDAAACPSRFTDPYDVRHRCRLTVGHGDDLHLDGTASWRTDEQDDAVPPPPAGVWVSHGYRSDGGMPTPFASEVEAARHALDAHQQASFVPFGTEVPG